MSQLRFDRASLPPKNILSEQKADRFTLCEQSVVGKLGVSDRIRQIALAIDQFSGSMNLFPPE